MVSEFLIRARRCLRRAHRVVWPPLHEVANKRRNETRGVRYVHRTCVWCCLCTAPFHVAKPPRTLTRLPTLFVQRGVPPVKYPTDCLKLFQLTPKPHV